MKKQKVGIVGVSVIASALLFSGCGILPNKEEVTKPKSNEMKKNEGSEQKTAAGEKQETGVKTQVYVIDQNGYVVPQTLMLPTTQSVTKQALEYLVADGPVDNMIPNGFRASLPAGTTVLGMNLSQDGKVATVDFSKEFLTYKQEDEQRVLQAVAWTVTQFDKVENVQIRVEGKDLKEMPLGKTPVGEGLSRKDGINMDYQDVVDITNTRSLTIYYVAQNGKETYYVPITKRVSNLESDDYKAVVDQLVKGPSSTSNLSSDFNSDVKLLAQPVYEGGKLTLNFNENILTNGAKSMISNYTINALVLSLTEQAGVESVAIQVNGKSDIINEAGQKLDKAVSRPVDVNTGSF
ncbi:MAG: GerMN domain-containing protein [Bacillaceae bacterium]